MADEVTIKSTDILPNGCSTKITFVKPSSGSTWVTIYKRYDDPVTLANLSDSDTLRVFNERVDGWPDNTLTFIDYEDFRDKTGNTKLMRQGVWHYGMLNAYPTAGVTSALTTFTITLDEYRAIWILPTDYKSLIVSGLQYVVNGLAAGIIQGFAIDTSKKEILVSHAVPHADKMANLPFIIVHESLVEMDEQYIGDFERTDELGQDWNRILDHRVFDIVGYASRDKERREVARLVRAAIDFHKELFISVGMGDLTVSQSETEKYIEGIATYYSITTLTCRTPRDIYFKQAAEVTSIVSDGETEYSPIDGLTPTPDGTE